MLRLILLVASLSLALPLAAQTNDNCTGALALNVQQEGAVIYTPFNSTTATASTPAPPCTGLGADDDLWYSFTAPGREVHFTFQNYAPARSTSRGMGFTILDACGGATLECDFLVGAEADGSGRQLAPETANATAKLTPGATYLLRVFAQGEGGATAEIALVTAANDDCDAAMPLAISTTESPASTTADTRLATRSENRPGCTGVSANDDIWYSFVPTTPSLELSYDDLQTTRGSADGVGYTVSKACPEMPGEDELCAASIPATNGAGTTTLTPPAGFTAGETYYLRVFQQGGESAGTFNLSLQEDASLPAELLSFTGRAEDKHNALHWTVTAEEGVDHYEVQKGAGAGAVNWGTVATRPARNGGQVAQTYVVTHEEPDALTYYRLVTVDEDGSEAFSPIISIERGTADGLAGMTVSPNPTDGRLVIDYRSASAEVELEVVDLSGRVVRSRRLPGGAGAVTVELSDLPAGTYLAKLTDEAGRSTRRVVLR